MMYPFNFLLIIDILILASLHDNIRILLLRCLSKSFTTNFNFFPSFDDPTWEPIDNLDKEGLTTKSEEFLLRNVKF
jgi:hypothetical protein